MIYAFLKSLFGVFIDLILFAAVWHYGTWWLSLIVFVWSIWYYHRVEYTTRVTVAYKYKLLLNAIYGEMMAKGAPGSTSTESNGRQYSKSGQLPDIK